MTVLLLFKLDQIEQETSASCSFFFFFFYVYLFSSSKHWELKSIDFGMGRMVGKPKVLLGFLADLKMSQLYNETLMWLSSQQSMMNDSSAWKMFHCFSPCPAGAPYPPTLIKQRCTLPLIKQRGSTDVMVQNFCWPSQPTNWVKMSPAVDLCCKNWLPPLHLGFNSYWRYDVRENLEIVDN